jgi:hypothetical protein
MDHVTLAILLPLLHEAFATTDHEWAPTLCSIGDAAFGTTIPVPGASVVYRLNVSTSSTTKGALHLHLSRAVEPTKKGWAGLPATSVLPVMSTMTTSAIADWQPLATSEPLTTVLAKLMVYTQEAATTLTQIADGYSNV